jgi:hypothetical protein
MYACVRMSLCTALPDPLLCPRWPGRRVRRLLLATDEGDVKTATRLVTSHPNIAKHHDAHGQTVCVHRVCVLCVCLCAGHPWACAGPPPALWQRSCLPPPLPYAPEAPPLPNNVMSPHPTHALTAPHVGGLQRQPGGRQVCAPSDGVAV